VGNPRIDPEVLKHTVEVATERNREDRMRFSIVADLTTPVQIGDLVEIDRSKEPRSWRVIEGVALAMATGRVPGVDSKRV